MSDVRHLQSSVSEASRSGSLSSPFSNEAGPAYEAPQEPPQSRSAGPKKRKTSSKGKVPAALKRSISTPHIHTLTISDEGRQSPGGKDQKRNKLGYHRTSVACGHCRRRKIRCLVDSDDPQGRCSNCIRLKKDCHFYPVEQTPPAERTPSVHAGLEAPSANPSTPSTASPAIASEAATPRDTEYDRSDHGQGDSLYTYTALPTSQTGLGLSFATSGSSRAQTPLYSQEPEGQQVRADTGPTLQTSFAVDEGHFVQQLSDPWGTPGPAMDPRYQSVHQQSLPLRHHATQSPQPIPYPMHSRPPGPPWPMPSRSMSYGTIEGSHGHFHSPGYPGQQHLVPHSPAYGFAIPPDIGHSSSISPIPEPHVIAMSSPMGQQHSVHFQNQYYQHSVWGNTGEYDAQIADPGGGHPDMMAGGQWYTHATSWDPQEQREPAPQDRGGGPSFYPRRHDRR